MPHRRTGVRAAATLAAVSLLAAATPAPATEAPADAPRAAVAQGAGLSFALEASAGQVAGSASELVFDYPLGEKFKVSELTWDLQDVALAGVRASVGLGRRLTFSAGVRRALSEGRGGMVDRDWMYSQAIAFGLLDADDVTDDDWTHESRHPDTTVDEATLLDLGLSVLAWESGPLRLGGVLGFARDSWSWSARGGTFVYSRDGFRDWTGQFRSDDGREPLVISYEQRYSIPYVGLTASWEHPVFRISARVLASPAVSGSDEDYHALRDTTFDGEFSGGAYLGLGADATWAFAGRWYATLSAEHRSIGGLTGDLTVRAPDGTWRFGDAAGVSLRATLITLGAGCRF